MALFILRRSLPRPAQRVKATSNPRFISLSPVLWLLTNAIAEDPFDGDVLATLNPILDEGLPSVLIVPLLPLLGRGRAQLG
jgi:hypothetical protein